MALLPLLATPTTEAVCLFGFNGRCHEATWRFNGTLAY